MPMQKAELLRQLRTSAAWRRRARPHRAKRSRAPRLRAALPKAGSTRRGEPRDSPGECRNPERPDALRKLKARVSGPNQCHFAPKRPSDALSSRVWILVQGEPLVPDRRHCAAPHPVSQFRVPRPGQTRAWVVTCPPPCMMGSLSERGLSRSEFDLNEPEH